LTIRETIDAVSVYSNVPSHPVIKEQPSSHARPPYNHDPVSQELRKITKRRRTNAGAIIIQHQEKNQARDRRAPSGNLGGSPRTGTRTAQVFRVSGSRVAGESGLQRQFPWSCAPGPLSSPVHKSLAGRQDTPGVLTSNLDSRAGVRLMIFASNGSHLPSSESGVFAAPELVPPPGQALELVKLGSLGRGRAGETAQMASPSPPAGLRDCLVVRVAPHRSRCGGSCASHSALGLGPGDASFWVNLGFVQLS
jgi:hypothetical protein